MTKNEGKDYIRRESKKLVNEGRDIMDLTSYVASYVEPLVDHCFTQETENTAYASCM